MMLRFPTDYPNYKTSPESKVFAEHYQSPYKGKSSVYLQQCKELKENVFKPLIEYFKSAINMMLRFPTDYPNYKTSPESKAGQLRLNQYNYREVFLYS